MKENCNHDASYGMILRLLTTLLILYLISKFASSTPFVEKYLLLILAGVLTLLDSVDNTVFRMHHVKKTCTKFFFYQINDKLVDAVSYLMLFFFFKLDNYLLYFILYRIVGVGLFSWTKNSKWLILFFDFAKEYLVYQFLFPKTFKYLPFFVLAKIAFEFFFHSFTNSTDYRKAEIETQIDDDGHLIGVPLKHR